MRTASSWFSWVIFALALTASGAHCGTSSNDAPEASASGSSSGAGTDGSTGDDAAAPVTVTPFDQTLFAFNGAAGGARRTTAQASFPTGTFQRIDLEIRLECPTGGCDHYDRTGSLGVVTEPAVDGGTHGAVVEVARFVTPFGVGAGPWKYDVTDLAPLLSGTVMLQGFIDTWSPQGQPQANGAGWLLTATFTFTPGTPAKTPIANLPLWPWPADNDPSSVPYGDSNKPLSAYMKPQTIALPPGASWYSLRTFVTGHGQGNTDNCAEFCEATHTITVGSMPFKKTPWRTCCTPDPTCEAMANPTPASGVAPGQRGTYMYPRAGWCPGASVQDWTQDVTAAVGSGSTAMIAWGLDSYRNLCRDDFPDAGADGAADAPSWDGAADAGWDGAADAASWDGAADAASDGAADAGTGAGSDGGFDAAGSNAGMCSCDQGDTCAYDGAGHTEPIFYISSLLIAYK